MGHVTFVIGGARSGKSNCALGLGSKMPGRKGFIATAEALDGEMKERIAMHRKTRPTEWETIEEPLTLNERLRTIDGAYNVVLIDCLTLWLSNMLGREEDIEPPKGNENPPLPPFRKGAGFPLLRSIATGRGGFDRGFSDERIKAEIEHLTSVLKDVSYNSIVVSNEVGQGIVPENKVARLFRDMSGWMNREIASVAEEVYLVTCGIPLKIK